MAITKNAQAVLEKRYLIKDEKGTPTETVDQLFHRASILVAWVCAVAMVLNMAVSAGALIRYSQRQADVPASGVISCLLDEFYGDDYLEHRYQNMRLAK